MKKTPSVLVPLLFAGLLGCQDERPVDDPIGPIRPKIREAVVSILAEPSSADQLSSLPAYLSVQRFHITRSNCRRLVDEIIDALSRQKCNRILDRKDRLELCAEKYPNETDLLGERPKQCQKFDMYLRRDSDLKRRKLLYEWDNPSGEEVQYIKPGNFDVLYVRINAEMENYKGFIVLSVPDWLIPISIQNNGDRLHSPMRGEVSNTYGISQIYIPVPENLEWVAPIIEFKRNRQVKMPKDFQVTAELRLCGL